MVRVSRESMIFHEAVRLSKIHCLAFSRESLHDLSPLLFLKNRSYKAPDPILILSWIIGLSHISRAGQRALNRWNGSKMPGELTRRIAKYYNLQNWSSVPQF